VRFAGAREGYLRPLGPPPLRDTGAMSERVRIVELLTRLMTSQDVIRRMKDEEFRAEGIAAIAAVTQPDFEFALIAPPELGISAEYRGVDGFVEGWEDWLSPFDRYLMEPGKAQEVDDRVVAFARMRATPKGTSAAIETEGGAVFHFEGDKIRRIEFHLDPDEALRAAGLEP
jgi:hypothetical protein